MTPETYYVLRTDKMSVPHYFAGISDQVTVGLGTTLTTLIFAAWQFATREDAEEARRECGLADDFTISDCEMGMSDNLMPSNRKARRARK